MALKPLRAVDPYSQRIDMFLNSVMERGGIVVYDTSVSGLGDMDDAGSLAKVPLTTSGTEAPIGVLMNDVVDRDLTRDRLNWHQDEVQKNSKVCILQKGSVRTNLISAGNNPVPGSGAYFTTSGYFTTTLPAGAPASSLVGRWGSSKDVDGYAVVVVNLPN